VCYRVSDDEIQFLLVRTQSGKWTFPKGGVEDDATSAAAASREAFEEAGVRGDVEPRPFASYVHCKSSALKTREMEVSAHLCRVSHVGRALEPHRDPTWFCFEAAKKRVRANRRRKYAAELERVLEQAMERIRRRTRQ
jgi:8-oxo-dGTP pyrophosphatase MutT (NUDIX family)